MKRKKIRKEDLKRLCELFNEDTIRFINEEINSQKGWPLKKTFNDTEANNRIGYFNKFQFNVYAHGGF